MKTCKRSLKDLTKNNKTPFVSAVIPAAGQGIRMGAKKNKTYLDLKGKPILAHAIEEFEKLEIVKEIIVVIQEDEIELCQLDVLEPYQYKKVQLVLGGKTRQESVYKGLLAVDKRCDLVMIHDGARPMINQEVLLECIDETMRHQASVVAVPAKNTMKIVGNNGFVISTPKRETIFEVHTPQTFDYKLIVKAHEHAIEQNFVGTDDASLVEAMGIPVYIIKGNYSNIKITTPEDLVFAEGLLGN